MKINWTFMFDSIALGFFILFCVALAIKAILGLNELLTITLGELFMNLITAIGYFLVLLGISLLIGTLARLIYYVIGRLWELIARRSKS